MINATQRIRSGDGLTTLGKATVTSWQGDWSSFKKRFRAAGNLNGVRDALRAGELLASRDTGHIEESKMAGKVAHQSERLAALLVLALEPTKGAQRSLVVNTSTSDEDNGVLIWANLIKYFETSTRETRIASLLQLWERETLKQSEHPDELYGCLTAINSRLAGLGEEYTDTKLLMRFISAVERSGDERYSPAIQQYYGAQIQGSGYTLDQLRELLARVNATSEAVKMAGPTLKGLATTPKCAHCGKLGHVENDCWTRHPTKAPSRKPDRHKTGWKRLCWECGKEGHIAAECPMKNKNITDSIVCRYPCEDV